MWRRTLVHIIRWCVQELRNLTARRIKESIDALPENLQLSSSPTLRSVLSKVGEKYFQDLEEFKKDMLFVSSSWG